MHLAKEAPMSEGEGGHRRPLSRSRLTGLSPLLFAQNPRHRDMFQISINVVLREGEAEGVVQVK